MIQTRVGLQTVVHVLHLALAMSSNTGSLIFDPQQKSEMLNTLFSLLRTYQLKEHLPTQKSMTLKSRTQVYASYFQTAIHTNQLVLTLSIQVF